MTSSEDTEITLGTGKLLVLFFVLVGICAGSFALGYKLGSKSEPAVSSASAALPLTAASGTTKPASSGSTSPSAASLKPVEQKSTPPDASTNAADTKAAVPADASNPANPTAGSSASSNPAAGTPNSADSTTTLPTSPYFVQVAAVSKQEDADALVDALKKKDYPAFVAAASDKLFRIQVGPFPDIKDAEAMRTRLIGDGYNPIVKK
jgi:DedD protein